MLFAIGLLFIALEEISWGQRIFDIKSSDWLIANNYQQEITIHNINDTWNIMLVIIEFSGQSNLFHVTIYSTLFQTLNELVLAQLSLV